MSYDYCDSLNETEKVRYNTKLESAGLETCPYRLPGDSWINDPTRWPKIEWPEVYSYLISTPDVHTQEAMKNRKSLEATNQFQSGRVRTVLMYSTPKMVILKVDVMPSQRTNDEPHKPWVAFTKEAIVSSGHCTCMAWLGESCSHIAALLFKVEAAVRMGYCDKSCTENPCKWNNDFTKKVTPCPVSRVKLYEEATKTRQRASLVGLLWTGQLPLWQNRMNCYKVSNSVKIPLWGSVSSPASMTDTNTKHQFQKKSYCLHPSETYIKSSVEML